MSLTTKTQRKTSSIFWPGEECNGFFLGNAPLSPVTLCQAYFDFGFPIFEPLPPHTVQWEASLTAVCPFQGGKVGRVEGVVSRAQGRRLHPHGSQVQGQVRPDPDALLHLRLGEQKRDPQVLAEPDPREELRHRSAGGQEQFSRWSFNISSHSGGNSCPKQTPRFHPYTSYEEPRSISRDPATFLQDFHVRRKREVISLPHSFVSFQRVLYKEKGAR